MEEMHQRQDWCSGTYTLKMEVAMWLFLVYLTVNSTQNQCCFDSLYKKLRLCYLNAGVPYENLFIWKGWEILSVKSEQGLWDRSPSVLDHYSWETNCSFCPSSPSNWLGVGAGEPGGAALLQSWEGDEEVVLLSNDRESAERTEAASSWRWSVAGWGASEVNCYNGNSH